MKNTFFLLVTFLVNTLLIAQNTTMPIVRANTTKGGISLQGYTINWEINPVIALDEYNFIKITEPTPITFSTDTDTLRFTLQAGEQKNFVVLLNGKDSCYTRIAAAPAKNLSSLQPEIHDSIPFKINKYNTNLVDVVINKVDTLTLNFDTGATDVDITKDALSKGFRSARIILYAKRHTLTIGNNQYYSVVFDTQSVGHEAEGLLGWNLFDGMIVELNYTQRQMVIHSKLPDKKVLSGYTKLPLYFIRDRPFIKATIAENGTAVTHNFLFDLGYQKSVMLDADLLAEQNFSTQHMDTLKTDVMYGIHNNKIPVVTLNLQKLQLGTIVLENVPVQLIATESKPWRGFPMHILGSDVLKRFTTVFDFQENVVYLKPNQLFTTTYLDTKTDR